MKAVVLLVFVALAFAQEVPIVHQDSEMNADGTYHYSYETGNGIVYSESGAGNAVTGELKYTDADGVPVQMQFTADENGYQPQGAHLHGIPEAIQRSLEWNEKHPEEWKEQ